MRIAGMWTVCIVVWMAVRHPCSVHAEDTQDVLSKYKEDIEKTWANNPKQTDEKVRNTLLQQLRATFSKDIQSAPAPKKTVSQHFDALLGNIATANYGFRFKDGAKFREQFIRDAAAAFVKEVKSATDLNASRTPNGWFDAFAGMMQQIRDRLALYKGLANTTANTVSPTFLVVYRASSMSAKTDAAGDYKEQVATIKRMFPVTKPDLKERNGAFATVLENLATTMFKERTK